MIIDVILDRRGFEQKDGDYDWYTVHNLRDIYNYAMTFGYDYISRAIDSGTEKDVKDALCQYIDENKYKATFKKYIRSVEWLDNVMAD